MDKKKLFLPPEGEQNEHAYQTPLEQKVNELLTPFNEYISYQATASILLLICTVTALTWASMPSISSIYSTFVSLPVGIYIDKLIFDKPLQFWVNDILLTLFFFFVGLEIKREFLVGQLTNRKYAIFVTAAAIGGMIVPSTIYFLLNKNSATQIGWGIPMATDTAFALGILTCFRKYIPQEIFTIMAALAIIDDIGAIIVIAVFYTAQLNTDMLFLALVCFIALILMNYAGFRKPLPYLIIGIIIWSLVEAAGIHGTIAGISVAFAIPARPAKGPKQFITKIRRLLNYFEARKSETPLILADQEQHAVLEEVQEITQQATTPLQRWENKLELPISIIVLPLFALVNAGIPINTASLTHALSLPLFWGIFIGLVIGKPLGVLLFGYFTVWTKLGEISKNIHFFYLFSAFTLTGIGFTMSLFVADLSFQNNTNALIMAKTAIVISSATAALLGIIFLLFTIKRIYRE